MIDMADWSKDEYRVRCSDSEALKRAHEILLDAGGVFSTPLEVLMDRLGFTGDRSGLTEGSAFSSLEWTPGRDGRAEEFSFVVLDNFSQFDPARALVDRVGVPMSFMFRCSFEDCGIRNDSGWIKPDGEIVPRDMLVREARNLVRSLVGGASAGKTELSFQHPVETMMLEAVGPEDDRLVLRRSPFMEGGPEEMSLRIGEMDVHLLDRLVGFLREERDYRDYRAEIARQAVPEDVAVDLSVQWFSLLEEGRQQEILSFLVTMNAVSAYGRLMVQEGLEGGRVPVDIYRDLPLDDMKVAEGLDRALEENDPALTGGMSAAEEVDFGTEREKVLEELYGSSSAYQNVSSFMRGFDVVYLPEVVVPLSREEVLEQAARYGLEFEVQRELDDGETPEAALREWDVDFPERARDLTMEGIEFRYDGDVMLSFSRPCYGGSLWEESFREVTLLELFEQRTGMNLYNRLGLDDGSFTAAFTTETLAGAAREALLSPQNRREVKEAELRCRRHLKQKDMLERLNAAPARKETNLKKRG